MPFSSALPKLFKSEWAQLEKLRKLELRLRSASSDELPEIENSIDAVMGEISHLIAAIRDYQSNRLSA
jgi:hypothetical protein